MKLTIDERDKLSNILIDNTQFIESTRDFLINQVGMPRTYVNNLRIKSDMVGVLASDVISYLERYGRLNEPPHKQAIWALIDALLRFNPGKEDREFLEGLVKRYKAELLDLPPLEQTPSAEQAKSPEAYEVIKTVGEWFTEANYLIKGAQSVRAVCRVEAPDGSTGTGFLVGKNLVLTNYHVVSGNKVIPDDAEFEQKAKQLTFRFGYLLADGKTLAGQEVKPFADGTVVLDKSVMSKLDFALLKLNEAVGVPEKLGILDIDPRNIATPETAVILQHPGGMEMKFHANRIVNYGCPDPLDEGKCRVHYLTNTLPGSSGSPVFDHNWQVIALHHSSGNVGNEGIPMKGIWPRIAPFINNA